MGVWNTCFVGLQNTKGNVSSFLLPPFPPLGNPSSRGCLQPNSCFHLTIMCIALFCSLNSKLAFLLFVLLFLPIGQFPPLYSARPVVQIQCYGDYTHSKGDNNDDEDDGADSFIQSCPSTEDRVEEGYRAKRIPASPSRPHPPLPHPPSAHWNFSSFQVWIRISNPWGISMLGLAAGEPWSPWTMTAMSLLTEPSWLVAVQQ